MALLGPFGPRQSLGSGLQYHGLVLLHSPDAYWGRTPGAKCYGFAYTDRENFIAMFQAHSATNMFFDLAIFATPLILFRTPNLKFKNMLALAGVFTFGAV